MVAARDLVEGVAEDVGEHRQRIGHPAARSRQVDDERPSCHTCEAAREHCRGDTSGDAVGTKGFGDAGDEPVEQWSRLLGREVGGGEPRASRSEDQLRGRGDGVTKGSADCGTVRHDHGVVDAEAPTTELLGEQRTRAVRIGPGGSPGGGDDDDRTTPDAEGRCCVTHASPLSGHPTWP